MAWGRGAKGGDGAEQYGAVNPTGNLSAKDMAELERRAPSVSPEERARFLAVQEEAYRKRDQN